MDNLEQLQKNLEENESYSKIVKATIQKYLNELSQGKVKVDNINDFERLVKLDAHLKEQDLKYRTLLSNHR